MIGTRRHIFPLLLATLVSVTALADEIDVTVNGMVCSLCAHGLKKKFGEQDAIREIAVDIGKRLVTLHLQKEQEISDEAIQEVVEWAGYEVEKIERRSDSAQSEN